MRDKCAVTCFSSRPYHHSQLSIGIGSTFRCFYFFLEAFQTEVFVT